MPPKAAAHVRPSVLDTVKLKYDKIPGNFKRDVTYSNRTHTHFWPFLYIITLFPLKIESQY